MLKILNPWYIESSEKTGNYLKLNPRIIDSQILPADQLDPKFYDTFNNGEVALIFAEGDVIMDGCLTGMRVTKNDKLLAVFHNDRLVYPVSFPKAD